VRNTDNVVLLMSSELLQRPWCAAEIVCAHKSGINFIPIVMEQGRPVLDSPGGESPLARYMPPNVEAAFDQDSWALLNRYGIGLEDVVAAYASLLSLKPLHFPGNDPAAQFEVISEMANNHCGQGWLGFMKGSGEDANQDSGSKSPRSPGISPVIVNKAAVSETELTDARSSAAHILCDNEDREAVSTAQIIKSGLPRDFLESNSVFLPSLHLDEIMKEPAEYIKETKMLLIILSPGLMASGKLSGLLLEYMKNDDMQVQMVRTDRPFEFPNASYYQSVVEGTAFSETPVVAGAPVSLEDLKDMYQGLFKIIACSLSTNDSQSVIQAQVGAILSRLQSAQTAKQLHDSAEASLSTKYANQVCQSEAGVFDATESSLEVEGAKPLELEPMEVQVEVEGKDDNGTFDCCNVGPEVVSREP